MQLVNLIAVLTFSGFAVCDYYNDTCAPGRTVIVHLFNWKWTDIALECETFLGPKGFCGVQVSPPNEHVVITSPNRPWWERYQPVSYKLISRSGNQTQFANMVTRCNNVNVRIYVDAVINHMTGATGAGSTGGTSFDPSNLNFPGVPYSASDFNCCQCGACYSTGCGIDYNDANEVRNCRLYGMPDLNQGNLYVRQKIADYMNSVIELGVAGFRIDALKSMWPSDIANLLGLVNNLCTQWFPANTRPFFFNEVVDDGTGAVRSTDYTSLGKVTEFKYSNEIGKAFRNYYTISNLKTIGPTWSMLPSDHALVFVCNHDNQRSGQPILTFYDAKLYKMATAFTLANNYGFTQIISSYRWAGGPTGGYDVGPPENADHTIKTVTFNPDGSCDDGSAWTWVCEHRWRQITNMVQFRNVVSGTSQQNWWDNGANQIAFSRGNSGFIAINAEISATLNACLNTGLPYGVYCDVISGGLVSGQCTGLTVAVDGSGYAQINIPVTAYDPMIATYIGAQLTGLPCQSPPRAYSRTVILINMATVPGQDLFIRGGITQRSGCTSTPETNPCSVSLFTNSIGQTANYAKYNAWRIGSTKLNWGGAQAAQGAYQCQAASGTPAVWTTNVQSTDGYQPLNTYGANYWMLDMKMNCPETYSGWFEFKGFVTNYSGGWENDVNQNSGCTGTAGGSKPYSSGNHFARCGFVNVFQFNSGTCIINNF